MFLNDDSKNVKGRIGIGRSIDKVKNVY